eukprot:TRINITY_DN483_c0_g1_i1.p1 TRINITY_DN483_c0_g1~~TRINITY_DN483_c0_g1_i1.p1  ORF type:complete len:228 (+),score=25.05 TRINITY_DN483_c0_g1_i1:78-761(+)
MLLQRIIIGFIASLFGIVLISTGKTVYDIGTEILSHATEESCTTVVREQLPCSYNCGGLLSAPRNCTGHSYRYTSIATGKCGDKEIVFDEYATFKKKGMSMCRCSKREPSGDCWVDFPGFTAGKSYQCTVQNSCDSFDLTNPSDYKTTGEVNIILGVIFIVFSICPEHCVMSTSLFCIGVFSYIVPMIKNLSQFVFDSINRWLRWMIDYTSSPADEWFQSEREPLLG